MFELVLWINTNIFVINIIRLVKRYKGITKNLLIFQNITRNDNNKKTQNIKAIIILIFLF